MHVSDLVDAYDLIARSSDLSGVTLNVGTGETPSIREIAEFVVDKTGASIVYEQPRPGEVLGFCLDTSRVLNLGFSPKICFWEGVVKRKPNGTVAFFMSDGRTRLRSFIKKSQKNP